MALADQTRLPDVLAKVPQLLMTCLARWEEHLEGIKVLRLVNKEIGRTASAAATNCSIQLGLLVGDKRNLTATQLVMLMSHARLESLLVTINQSSGYMLLTEQEQLIEVVQGMGLMLASVKTLTIRCQHKDPINLTTALSTLTTAPASPCVNLCLMSVASMCLLLGPAIPLLSHLCVEGCCDESAFQALGNSCAHLTHLEIDTSFVSVKALTNLDFNLPNVSCITLKNPSMVCSNSQLSKYVGSCLLAISNSLSLYKMVLKFEEQVQLVCERGKWNQSPRNMRELISHCEISQFGNAPAFLSRLHVLSLATTSGFVELLEILTHASALKELAITGPAKMILQCNSIKTTGDAPLLTKCILEGLQVNVPSIRMCGTSLDMNGVLASLPAMPSVHSCTLRYKDTHEPPDLAHISRVLPNVTQLHLLNRALGQPVQGVEMLLPLGGCSCLEQLRMCLPVKITTSELADICMGMHSLRTLGYSDCSDVEMKQLNDVLHMQGHTIDVENCLYAYDLGYMF